MVITEVSAAEYILIKTWSELRIDYMRLRVDDDLCSVTLTQVANYPEFVILPVQGRRKLQTF